MTYQNTSEQFPAGMTADGSTVAAMPLLVMRRGLAVIGAILGGFWDGVMRATDASSRVNRIQALQAKSDAELARMGIKRDMIVHHVFQDMFYA